MSDITSYLLSYVLLYKYLAIFTITFAGAFALPIPSGTVIIASAAFSTQGYLSLPWIMIIAILGNVAGDNCGYWITRNFGVQALHFLGIKKVVGSKKYQIVRTELNNHPILIIFFSRFMTGIAPTVNFISGLTKLAYKRYLVFEILGECAEVSFFATLGFAFGTNWETLTQFSGASWLIILSGTFLTYLLWRHIFKKADKDSH
jgi:membrane-associated protein